MGKTENYRKCNDLGKHATLGAPLVSQRCDRTHIELA